MSNQEAAISWVGYLTPLLPMPFSIVCTVSPTVKDQTGRIRQKLTIRLPVWDENDVSLYEAKLTESGHGIILTMPAAACFLRKLDHVNDLNKSWKTDGEQQTIDLHVAYCNKANEAGAIPTVQVLLLFPAGDTYNNKSFNYGVSNEFKLERKEAVVYEETVHPIVDVAIRTAIAFEVALDQSDGLNANAHQNPVEDVTQRMLRLHPYTPPANRRAAAAAAAGGQQGMSTGP